MTECTANFCGWGVVGFMCGVVMGFLLFFVYALIILFGKPKKYL